MALKHGWEPMGTLPPPGWHGFRGQPDWLGDYVWPDKQVVRDEDAQQLADALVRALEAGTAELGKATLRKIISVCRAGGFRIR